MPLNFLDILEFDKHFQVYTAYVSLIIGFPANALILFITMYNWHKRSASSWLVINLATADLFLVVNAFITVYDNDQNNKSRLIPDDAAFPRLRCAYKEYVQLTYKHLGIIQLFFELGFEH